jgi:hypothetical protein
MAMPWVAVCIREFKSMISPNKTAAHNILSTLPQNNTAQRHGKKDAILLLQSFSYMIPA